MSKKLNFKTEYPKKYSGTIQPQKGDKANCDYEDNNNNAPLLPYVPEKPLIESVNVARIINRPLLITGEPGCGKTMLAYDVHNELKEEIFEYRVHSDSTLKDAVYHYDGLRRLHDVESKHLDIETCVHHKQNFELINKISDQINNIKRYVVDQKKMVTSKNFQAYLEKANKTINELQHKIESENITRQVSKKNPENIENYINYNSLGKGLKKAEKDKRVIILIDEIENAPSQFQADILRLLDEGRFEIVESETDISFSQKNIFIVVTCNKHKTLSDAFLRRCIFHHIDFPNDDDLMKILQTHFKDMQKEVLKKVINFFNEFRDNKDWIKKPSLSELIDWLNIMIVEKINIEQALSSKEILYPGTLIKEIKDIEMLDEMD